MTALAIWALVGLGFVYLFTSASIFSRFRIRFARLGGGACELIYCPACIGFWVGAALALSGLFPTDMVPHGSAQALAQSAFAMMALGALWGRYGVTLDNDALVDELTEVLQDDDQAQESEDGQG